MLLRISNVMTDLPLNYLFTKDYKIVNNMSFFTLQIISRYARRMNQFISSRRVNHRQPIGIKTERTLNYRDINY